MLDINYVRKYPELVKENLLKRKDREKVKQVDELLELDENWRKQKYEVDKLRQKRNNISMNINKTKKEGKSAKSLILQAKKIPGQISKEEKKLEDLKDKIKSILMRIPNMLHESVPVGYSSEDNAVIRKWGKLKKPAFELKSHGELLEQLGLADFKRAAKISGAGFNFLTEKMALLDLALQRFAIDHMRSKGFKFTTTPMLMLHEAYKGVTSLEDFENVMYKVENDELHLIATSEHPLTAQYMNEVLTPEELPIKFCGLSSCFRKEIGGHGVDTKGIFRMHQFNKVEQVVICKQSESWEWHEKMQKYSEEILKKLKIPYRVVNICTGDIGILAAKKYDIEAWFPRQQGYAEVTSASNCTSYQAVRLNIKYQKTSHKRDYVHTLNNTALATSRIMVAILENYQQKDGTVKIPKALLKYCGFKKIDNLKS